MIATIFLAISVTLTFPADARGASKVASFYDLGSAKTLVGNELRDTDYHISIFANYWDAVKNECSGIGGTLLAIESPEEQELIDQWLENQTGEIFWTGGFYNENKNIWMWNLDTPLIWANWNQDQVGLTPYSYHRIKMVYDRNLKKSTWKQDFSKRLRSICEVRQ